MKRRGIPKNVQYKVFTRDGWHCRYCRDPVFFSPTLRLFDKLSPKKGYYHKNGKSGEMHPLFQWKFASVDHIVPVTRGGSNKISNLVTSCWECNLKYNNQLEGKPKPTEIMDNETGWDGFSSLYLKLSKNNDSWSNIIKKHNAEES